MVESNIEKIVSQWKSNGIINNENLQTFIDNSDNPKELKSLITIGVTKAIFYFHEMFDPKTWGCTTELRKIFANSAHEAVEKISKIGSINHPQDIMFLKIYVSKN